MASDKSRNLQEVFLNNVRKSHVAVTVFLVNGVKLQGIITWFDNFSILLKRDHHVQLVYKHAISTVVPARNPRAGGNPAMSTGNGGTAAPAGESYGNQ